MTITLSPGERKDLNVQLTPIQEVVGTYYSPFGGVRMPICTRIRIPDVNPFRTSGFEHPGGDLIWNGKGEFMFSPPIRTAIAQAGSQGQLAKAQPIEWTPAGATVTKSAVYADLGHHLYFFVRVMPVQYSCPEYWNSKEKLAVMIAESRYVSIPDEWILEYGTTCPNCNGTGQVICTERMKGCRPGQMTKCRTCNGLGKILRVDLVRGLRDWLKGIRYLVDYYNYTYTAYIWCPYCDRKLITGTYDTSPGGEGRLNSARFLLNHIESQHPNHPLTAPAWF